MERSHIRAARVRWLQPLAMMVALLILAGCVGRRVAEAPIEGFQTFNGSAFFAIGYPDDWVAADLPDGANLFFTGEVLFVRVKAISVPDRHKVEEQFDSAIRQEAVLHGGEPGLVRTGEKDGMPFRWYVITKPSGGRVETVLVYHPDLQLLYVIYGSSSEADFDEFSALFARMFDTFRFRISSRHPPAEPESFEADFTTMEGAWAAYMEGLRRRDLDLLTASMASINAPRLLNDLAVDEVRRRYFPYSAPLLTLVEPLNAGEKVGTAMITLRALPPEGFMKRVEREFIREDGQWKVLRFE